MLHHLTRSASSTPELISLQPFSHSCWLGKKPAGFSLSLVQFSNIRSVLCRGLSLMFYACEVYNFISIQIYISEFSDWQLSIEIFTRLFIQITVKITNLNREQTNVKKVANLL